MGDRESIEQVLAGEADAFRKLIDRYCRAVRVRAVRALPVPGLADEAAHETFVRAYQRLGSFDLERNFQSWLFGILHRVVNEYYGYLGGRAGSEAPVQELAAALWQWAQEDDELEEDNPYRRQLETAVAQLPADSRKLLQLAYTDGMCAAEISELLKHPPEEVRKTLSDVRQRLCQTIRDKQEAAS